MSRLSITTTAALAAAALVIPAGAGAAPVDVAAKLEAHAVVSSEKALSQVRASAAKVKRTIQRSELALKQAYEITVAEGQRAKADGLEASASFSAAAQAQGENLSAIVERSTGSVKTTAAGALAATGRMEAEIVAQVAADLEAQQDSASSEQGEDVASVGDAQAQLTATMAVTAASTGLRNAVAGQLDATTALSVKAQARLVEAVTELRERSEAQGQAVIASAQASLEQSGEFMAEALRRSGRWEVSYEETTGTGEGPVTVSATVQANAVVEHGGRR